MFAFLNAQNPVTAEQFREELKAVTSSVWLMGPAAICVDMPHLMAVRKVNSSVSVQGATPQISGAEVRHGKI
ncbi:MAG TPA: hypothetical protein PKV71_02490 [Calditrichia bacterium]|nr:hypothetical protein [Calditrichota bacterium]HQU71243.1 hypothetical protein [Calditrichia bacterium]HQV30709.1 hypothetical protein [Calditrichia bacterium]